MARLIISTMGSIGDLYPYIALGLGLRARGHTVVFAVEEAFIAQLSAQGFETARLNGDSHALLGPYRQKMVSGADSFSSLWAIAHHYLAPSLADNIALLRDLCVNADALIASVSQVAASAVAELVGVRWITIALSPTIPSAWVTPATVGPLPPGALGRGINRALWRLGGAQVARISDPPLNAVRARYGLPPRARLLQDGALSQTLTAVAISSAFLARPPDWPPGARVTGFLYWDVPGDWREPPELQAFLHGGSPVIAVSSGSLGPAVGDAFAGFFAASVEAIHRLGARALVIGAGDAFDEAGPETMCIEYAPFSLVYPRCAAVIHHGGSGTLGQSLRAGLPTAAGRSNRTAQPKPKLRAARTRQRHPRSVSATSCG